MVAIRGAEEQCGLIRMDEWWISVPAQEHEIEITAILFAHFCFALSCSCI